MGKILDRYVGKFIENFELGARKFKVKLMMLF